MFLVCHFPVLSMPRLKVMATVKNIQALRGIAALLVLWAHLRFPVMDLDPDYQLPAILRTPLGAIGVDLFFIISGYVISLTAIKKHNKSLDFFLSRIGRVAPLYLIISFPWILRGLFQWPQVPFRSFWNGIFYLPVFDWNGYSETPLSFGWTLSFEMWFYVVFALLLNFLKPSKVALFLPMLFSTGAAGMIFYSGAWFFPRFMFHPFVLEFSFGCLIFLTQEKVTGKLSWLLVAGGILYFLIFSLHSGYLGIHGPLIAERVDLAWLRVLLWGVPAALVVAGLIGLERCEGRILPSIFIWVGEISYSLYLINKGAIAIIHQGGYYVGLKSPPLIVIATVIVGLACGWLSWRWIEKPLTFRVQKWLRQKPHMPEQFKNSSENKLTKIPEESVPLA